MGWSRLSDLNVHDGKLLGCSYNQSCVGVWVVDISVLLRLLSFLPINGSFLVFLCWMLDLNFETDELLATSYV